MIDYRKALYAGHLGPIPLYIDWTALLLVYMAWQWSGVGSDVFQFLAFLAVLVASIVLHELGHGLTALALATRESERAMVIVLWAFGGVCIQQQREGRPWKEIAIVLAGPLVSLVLWLGCGAVLDWFVAHHPGAIIAHLDAEVISMASLTPLGLLLLLGKQMNLALLIFNMLPIYPFDGGQAVHNALKLVLRDFDLVRRISFSISVVVAAAYLAWQFQQSGQIPWFGFMLIGFMLYNGYVALFVYRR